MLCFNPKCQFDLDRLGGNESMVQQLTKCSIQCLAGVLLPTMSLAAATGNEAVSSGDWLWNVLIAVMVLLVCASSAALSLAAIRQWAGNWRYAAATPLGVLLIWLLLIVLSRLIAVDSHPLWPLELFAWAMLNMIYMVALMTTKRIFEKADKESSSSS